MASEDVNRFSFRSRRRAFDVPAVRQERQKGSVLLAGL